MTKLIYGVGVNDLKKNRSSFKYYDQVYVIWHGVLQRCYDPKWAERHPHYKNTSCDQSWFLFSNFYNDIVSMPNFLLVDELKLQLDKDLINPKENKYSVNNCSFVPRSINNLFVSNTKDSEKEGLTWRERNRKFQARISIFGKVKNLGLFSDALSAKKVYDLEKTKYVHQLADIYKDIIHKDVYNNLINFKGYSL